jgi:hypothetical protein
MDGDRSARVAAEEGPVGAEDTAGGSDDAEPPLAVRDGTARLMDPMPVHIPRAAKTRSACSRKRPR